MNTSVDERHPDSIRQAFLEVFDHGMSQVTEAITEKWDSMLSWTVHEILDGQLPIVRNERSQRVAIHHYLYAARTRDIRHNRRHMDARAQSQASVTARRH